MELMLSNRGTPYSNDALWQISDSMQFKWSYFCYLCLGQTSNRCSKPHIRKIAVIPFEKLKTNKQTKSSAGRGPILFLLLLKSCSSLKVRANARKHTFRNICQKQHYYAEKLIDCTPESFCFFKYALKHLLPFTLSSCVSSFFQF